MPHAIDGAKERLAEATVKTREWKGAARREVRPIEDGPGGERRLKASWRQDRRQRHRRRSVEDTSPAERSVRNLEATC